MPTEIKRRKSIAGRIFGALWYLAVCAVFLGIGSAAGWVATSPILTNMVLTRIGLRSSEPKTVFDSDEMTVLVLGCDEDRYYGGKQILRTAARSDMMLLAKFDFANNRVGGVSIPRDLWVNLPGYSGHKINAYHAIGGPDLAKQAVEHILGVRIDRVMVLNYEAFKDMIDLVGGVEVYIPKNMDYDDVRGGLHIHLKKGRRNLTGYDAMGFIRFRHSDSDFARIDRQRDLMLAFKRQVLQDPAVLPAVVEKAAEVMNGEFNTDEISALSVFMNRVKNDNIRMGTLPVFEGSGTNLILDTAKVEETLQTHYILSRSTRTASRIQGGDL